VTGWIPQPPRPISPAPAAGRDDLRGRRVLVGHPGHGWRGDLRADAAVVQGARTYIPVLTEQEWYRAELEQMFDRRIHLFLFVKVRENWVEDPERYAALGLDYNA